MEREEGGGKNKLQIVISKTFRARRKLESRLEEFLNIYPCEARVGLIGVAGVKPKAYIGSSHDRIRMLELVGEKPFIQHVLSVLKKKPNGCFLDIGAAEGLYTLLAAEVLKKGRVVAIEPEPDICKKLNKNLTLNDFESIVDVLEIAVTDREDVVCLNTNGSEGRAPGMGCAGKFNKTIEVQGLSIDSLVDKGMIPCPDFVKIDVEGAEGLVLSGMRRLLCSRFKPKDVFLEMHSEEMLREFGYSIKEIKTYLNNMGYKEVFSCVCHGQPLVHFSNVNGSDCLKVL